MSSGWVPGFAPTHQIPPDGLDAWAAPDAAIAPAARLDAGLAVQVTQWWGDWAGVTCSNGWATWVDGRRLTAYAPHAQPPPTPVPSAPPAPAPQPQAPPQPVYTAPPAYAPPPTYPSPAAPQPAAASPVARAVSGLPPGVDPAALVGAALVLVGSFLPWVSFGIASASAWDISVNFLISGSGTLSGFKAGFVLLAVVVAGVPFLTRRPLPPYTVEALGGLAVVIALLSWFRINDLGGGEGVDFGLFICLIGGVVMAAGSTIMKAVATPKR